VRGILQSSFSRWFTGSEKKGQRPKGDEGNHSLTRGTVDLLRRARLGTKCKERRDRTWWIAECVCGNRRWNVARYIAGSIAWYIARNITSYVTWNHTWHVAWNHTWRVAKFIIFQAFDRTLGAQMSILLRGRFSGDHSQQQSQKKCLIEDPHGFHFIL